MRRYAYIHNYGPVLDRTVQSGPAFSQTGPDCSLRVLNRRVRSFYRSIFLSDKKTGPNSPVQYFWNRTAVQRYWTVRSSLFTRSPKKATVRTGLDRGQSNYKSHHIPKQMGDSWIRSLLFVYITIVEMLQWLLTTFLLVQKKR
jgi:hypothetical protein